jgi:hypothetical protein
LTNYLAANSRYSQKVHSNSPKNKISKRAFPADRDLLFWDLLFSGSSFADFSPEASGLFWTDIEK